MKNSTECDEEKFRIIFEGASDGILVADIKTKKFILANPRICEITGYSQDELLKLSINEIHPQKDLPYVTSQFAKQTKGKISLAKDIPVLRKDKRVVYCDINSKPAKIGNKQCLVGFFRDITERKKAEEEFKSKVDELERFNKLAVGRELKMIELKKRIEELESRTKVDR